MSKGDRDNLQVITLNGRLHALPFLLVGRRRDGELPWPKQKDKHPRCDGGTKQTNPRKTGTLHMNLQRISRIYKEYVEIKKKKTDKRNEDISQKRKHDA